MRVGFCGTQGSGKTTLMKAVEKSSLGFTAVPSTARGAIQAGFKLNRDADPLSQLVTTVARCAVEDKIFRETGKTISDRTPLDSLAYTTYQISNVWEAQPYSTYYWSISRDLVAEHMHKYDLVVYFPPLWSPKADGVRDPDVAYQKEIDRIILTLVEGLDIQIYPIIEGNTSQRLNYLTKLIS